MLLYSISLLGNFNFQRKKTEGKKFSFFVLNGGEVELKKMEIIRNFLIMRLIWKGVKFDAES